MPRTLVSTCVFSIMAWLSLTAVAADATNVPGDHDLAQIRQAGVIRHLGVPYANFVTGSGDGLSIEIMRRFADHLGVKYVYVSADWDTVVPDLIGRKVAVVAGTAELGESTPIRGDVIANGLTQLPWRKQVLDFSTPTFPTQIWLLARADDLLTPITPSGTVDDDITRTRALLAGRSVLCKEKTCLDPGLFKLTQDGASPKPFRGSLNELAPALIAGEADNTILDVPDAVIALRKWPGRIKILGPMSKPQTMGVGFRKTSPELRRAFDKFFEESCSNGSYEQMVRKYYPSVADYFPGFFQQAGVAVSGRGSRETGERNQATAGTSAEVKPVDGQER